MRLFLVVNMILYYTIQFLYPLHIIFMTVSVFELFKIGIGPSSSHTVGPMIAAKRFVESLDADGSLGKVHRVRSELYGSLGTTGRGHGSAKAILLGLEGSTPKDLDIASIPNRLDTIRQTESLNLLGKQRVRYNDRNDLILHKRKSLPYHPNGMIFRAFDEANNEIITRAFYSIGGGFVIDEEDATKPVIHSTPTNVPYPFSSGKELLALCANNNMSIAQIIMENEKVLKDEKQIIDDLLEIWETMKECVRNGCRNEGILPGGLEVKRRAPTLYRRILDKNKDEDPLIAIDWVNVYAIAVNEENAAGGRVVTAPTNGAAGIVPAVLHYYVNHVQGATDKGIVDFFLSAAAVGALFKENASISGAEVGCQGEVGSACAMAAAGLAQVSGATAMQVENAAEIAMEHNLGLTCDPIGGLVQIPCIERNAVGANKAINAVRLALAGDGTHFVSLDKVIKTMRETGKDMKDKYKETARGGLATNVVEVPINIVDC